MTQVTNLSIKTPLMAVNYYNGLVMTVNAGNPNSGTAVIKSPFATVSQDPDPLQNNQTILFLPGDNGNYKILFPFCNMYLGVREARQGQGLVILPKDEGFTDWMITYNSSNWAHICLPQNQNLAIDQNGIGSQLALQPINECAGTFWTFLNVFSVKC